MSQIHLNSYSCTIWVQPNLLFLRQEIPIAAISFNENTSSFIRTISLKSIKCTCDKSSHIKFIKDHTWISKQINIYRYITHSIWMHNYYWIATDLKSMCKDIFFSIFTLWFLIFSPRNDNHLHQRPTLYTLT